MLKITSNCEFDSMKICELFFRLMSVWHNIGEDIINSEITMIHDDSLPEEGFRIQSDGCNVKVSGNGRRGISYGMAALANLYDGTRFPVADITESPAMPFRGVQMYMPGINELEGFYRIIDMMVMMRYNTLILEVGGGMEYKKHPEINIGWEKFCKNILAFPGGPNNFQGSDSYWKDSTHTEIGGGSYLPQDTVRNFVDYAKAYGIDIVPELQMFSHAYYITTVYPQFAERAEDHYPDTVCPQNEEAYKLYFELADEVLDVFGCNMVSIGHDEIRVIGKCGLCKDKTGHELLAYEINRLHEFYRSRGVQIAMWCETLQKIESYFTHKFFGGMGSSRTNSFGRVWETPATYDAIKYIPKDILLLDWLYGWSWESQEVAQQYGFKQIFGNFHGEYTRGWNRRKSSPCVIGGETSAWCSSDEYTLGHDGILGDFWFSSMMLWNKDYDEDQYEIYHKKMRKELPRLREVLQHRPSLMSSYKPVKTALIYANSDGENKINRDDLPQIFEQFDLPEEISGIPLGESEVNFNVGMNVDRLLFVHTSLGDHPLKRSYVINFEEWCPVVYAVRYADGETVFAHVRFGIEIGNINMKSGRHLGYRGATPEDSYGFETDPKDIPDPPLYELNHVWQNSLLYSAAPFYSGDKCLYLMEWINPKPEVAIEKIFAVNTAKSKNEQTLLYCVMAAK